MVDGMNMAFAQAAHHVQDSLSRMSSMANSITPPQPPHHNPAAFSESQIVENSVMRCNTEDERNYHDHIDDLMLW